MTISPSSNPAVEKQVIGSRKLNTSWVAESGVFKTKNGYLYPIGTAAKYDKMIVVGDSISAWGSSTGANPVFPPAGGVFPPSDRWHDQLVQRGLVGTRVDSSYPGYTSRDAVNNPIAPAQSADLTIIFLGANDQNSNYVVTPTEYGNNLRTLLTRYPAPKQIIMFPWKWNVSLLSPILNTEQGNAARRGEYLSVAQAVAGERGATFIDLGQTFNAPLTKPPAPLPIYLVDYLIHASAYGHTGIANVVQSVIAGSTNTGAALKTNIIDKLEDYENSWHEVNNIKSFHKVKQQ
jgi:lysophospholipase L1-like esterase